jgi:uncharacterized protein YjbI with pentapeptide repeats
LITLDNFHSLRPDCENCFALCCVALPYAASADFAVDKEAGTPCGNLQSDFRCSIHQNLRDLGYPGCTVFDCFGSGQKVSQTTFSGTDWRKDSLVKEQMFAVFAIMRQLHEMLWYLNEALNRTEVAEIHEELISARDEIEKLTQISSDEIIKLDVGAYRTRVNMLFLKTSELVRKDAQQNQRNTKLQKKIGRGADLIGANLKGAELRGANLRGAYLIAADLRDADLRETDLIGADFRNADIRGANLLGSIFLTQAQVNSANGDEHTKLPSSLTRPKHWL